MDKENKKNQLKRVCDQLGNIFKIRNFKQQQLPACRPILTITAVLPTFILTAFALIAIGIGFLYMSFNNRDFELDYTDCIPLHGSRTCAEILADWRERFNASWPPPVCVCWYKFRLEEYMKSNVYVYYALYNYFQNHLHYLRSKDLAQFHGKRSLAADCDPFRYKRVRVNGRWMSRPIVPCGTVANSLFNDTFTLWLLDRKKSVVQVPLSRTGIAWPVDQNNYRNPSKRSTFLNFTNPPYWGNITIWDLDSDNPDNNGLRNEALIVWMRVAAFPDFRKLYARVLHNKKSPFNQQLPRGQYYLKIQYNYPVLDFKGRKSFVLANTNRYFGSSYFFLAILYLIVGSFCAVGAIILMLIYKKRAVSKEESVDIDDNVSYFYRKDWREIQLRRAAARRARGDYR